MEESEEALVRRSQAGETDAFGALVKMFAGRAIGAAFVMLGSYDDALDASQDAFVRAWRNIRRFEGKAAFYTWYSAILRNVCLDRLKRRTRDRHAGLAEEHLAASIDSDPVLVAHRNEQDRRLWHAIFLLPLKQRDIIIVSHFHGMSYKEIAALMDIPIGTVMSRLHNARKALRDNLAGDRP